MAIQNRKDFKHIRVAEAVYRDTKLKASDKAVYTVLSLYADRNTSECFPKKQTILELASVGDKSFRAAIIRLRERGYIEVEERFVNNRQTSNVYRLLDVDN